MNEQLLLYSIILTSGFYTDVYGLQCYQCSYVKLITGSDLLDRVIGLFTKTLQSDEACLLKESDISKIYAKTCPPPTKGKTSVCSSVNGTITFSTALLDVKYITVSRDCAEVDTNSDKSQSVGKCYEEDASSDTFKKIADEYFKGLDVSRFQGKACYFVDSLGSELYPTGVKSDPLKSALQCYACSYNKILTGNDIINQIANLISKVSSDEACLMKNNNDMYEIDIKTCPLSSSEDTIQRCATIRGNITLEISGYTVVYQTTSRDCLEVNEDSEQATTNNKCYPEDRESTSLQTIVNEYFDGFTVSNFEGESCYYDKNLASEISPEGAFIGIGVKVMSCISLTLVMYLSTCLIHL